MSFLETLHFSDSHTWASVQGPFSKGLGWSCFSWLEFGSAFREPQTSTSCLAAGRTCFCVALQPVIYRAWRACPREGKLAWVGSNGKVWWWFRMITGKLVLFAPCTGLVSRTTKTDRVAPPLPRGVFSKLLVVIALVLPVPFQKSRWL